MKTAIIGDVIYKRDILLVYDYSLKELKKFYKKKGINAPITAAHAGTWVGQTSKKGYFTNYLFINTQKYKDCKINLIGTLAHELFHLVYHNLPDAGINLTEDSEEAYTYYYEMLFRQCLHDLGIV